MPRGLRRTSRARSATLDGSRSAFSRDAPPPIPGALRAPDDEAVLWELVSDGPWAANANYLGRRRTRIGINTSLPIGSYRLLELECAIEALLGDDAEAIAADCLRPVDIPYDPVTAAAVRRAETLLLPVRSNVALMLDAGATSSEARDYAKTWWPFHEPDLIDTAIAQLETRSWRPYESCYPVGRNLCRSYSVGDASWPSTPAADFAGRHRGSRSGSVLATG